MENRVHIVSVHGFMATRASKNIHIKGIQNYKEWSNNLNSTNLLTIYHTALLKTILLIYHIIFNDRKDSKYNGTQRTRTSKLPTPPCGGATPKTLDITTFALLIFLMNCCWCHNGHLRQLLEAWVAPPRGDQSATHPIHRSFGCHRRRGRRCHGCLHGLLVLLPAYNREVGHGARQRRVSRRLLGRCSERRSRWFCSRSP